MRDLFEPPKLVLYLIALIIGGSGGVLTSVVNPPRPDPFTGTEAIQLEARLYQRLSSVEEQHQVMLQTVIQLTNDAARTKVQISNLKERMIRLRKELDSLDTVKSIYHPKIGKVE